MSTMWFKDILDLFSHKDEGSFVILRETYAAREHHSRWIKPVSEKQVSNVFSCLLVLDFIRYINLLCTDDIKGEWNCPGSRGTNGGGREKRRIVGYRGVDCVQST